MQFLKYSGYFLLAAALVMAVSAQEKIHELEQKLKSNPNDETVLMELGRSYHDLASAGDKSAIEKGFDCFDRAYSLDSTNVVALAYRGSMWTLRALDSWWPPTKLNYFKRGSSEMDRAVELAPDNMMVRLIRGIDELDLPEFAGRLPTALEDFIVLLRHPSFPEQTRELKALIYYYAGIAHMRADAYDRARELFKKAISILPGSEFARRSQDALNQMGL